MFSIDPASVPVNQVWFNPGGWSIVLQRKKGSDTTFEHLRNTVCVVVFVYATCVCVYVCEMVLVYVQCNYGDYNYFFSAIISILVLSMEYY